MPLSLRGGLGGERAGNCRIGVRIVAYQLLIVIKATVFWQRHHVLGPPILLPRLPSVHVRKLHHDSAGWNY
jgi:hypothetical protein